jgi:RPA family protein
MCDTKAEINPDSKDFPFEAFKAKLEKAVTPGAKVTVTGPITNYVSDKGVQTIEIKEGKCVILEEGDPAEEVEKISVAAAIAIAEALAEPTENGKSTYDTKERTVVGYAGTVYANDDGTWSFYMADEAGAKGDFMASSCKADSDVNKGDFMAVTGKICKYKTKAGKIMYQIYKGSAAHSNDQGIENVELTEKAQKVMVDGVVYIVRDGKLFNLQGAQVR